MAPPNKSTFIFAIALPFAMLGILIGPFIDAYKRVHPEADVRHFLKGLEDHLLDAGIGSISEVFDTEEPHLPRGCIGQAWSVAELLRLRCTYL